LSREGRPLMSNMLHRS